jgi:molybdopterin-guanine dinucleotide biosynthesis protein B
MPCGTVAFVGRSGSGKTSLLIRIIPKLIKLNLRVGTLKHTHHIQSFDQPEKDSWKHRQAGAEQTVVLSDTEIGIFSAAPSDINIGQIKQKWFVDYDLLVIEGFKHLPGLKVEVYRVENSKSPLYKNPAYSVDALVTDATPPFPAPHFSFDEIDGLVEWMCNKLDLPMSV